MKSSPLLLALTLCAFLLPSPDAQARPPKRSSRAAARAAKAAQEAKALAAKYPPEMLVAMGKRPAFFYPNDLSKSPVLSAPSAIVIDADTGQTLWEKDADAKRFPASTTKILTALLFIENSKPDDVLTCLDPSITKIEESSLHIKPWEKFRAKDLLYGFLLRSGNDAAVMIAQHVAGSVPKFADQMNERARLIGTTHSHFVNPNGLHDPNHYTTARDMALIAREAMQNPRFEDAVGIPRRVIARSILARDNVVASRAKKQYYDKFLGADGVKTGYTRAAGHCFVGSATRDGRRLLSVVFGAKNSATSDTVPLLSWAFQRFPAVPIAAKGAPAPAVEVRGAARPVPTIAGVDFQTSTDSLAPNGPLAPAHQEVIARTDLTAPIAKGVRVGSLVVRDAKGTLLGEVPLFAAEAVEQSPVAAAASVGIPLIFWGTGGAGVVALVLIAFRYGTTSAKSPRRRRNRVATAGRGVDRGR